MFLNWKPVEANISNTQIAILNYREDSAENIESNINFQI